MAEPEQTEGDVVPPAGGMTSQPRGSVGLVALNGVSSLLTRLLQVAVLLWINHHLVTRIAPAEYSIYPLVTSLLIAAEVCKHVFVGGVQRYIVEADARGDDLGVTRVISSMFPYLIAAACAFALLGAAAIWQIDALIRIDAAHASDARWMLGLLFAVLACSVITEPFCVGLYARQRFVLLNAIDLTAELLRTALLIGLMFGLGTRVLWLVVATTIATLVRAMVLIVLTRRTMPAVHFDRALFSPEMAGTLFRFGAWTASQGFAAVISQTAPILILNRFAGALDVACYHLGWLPSMQLRRLVLAMAGPIEPVLTSVFALKGESALRDLYYRGGRYHLWITLIVAAPLLAFDDRIVLLYAGTKYAMAATVMSALLMSYPMVWASAMFFRIAHAIGRVGLYNLWDLVVQACSLLAMLFAVAVLGAGASGAAIAVTVAVIGLHLVLIWPLGLRLVHGRWNRFLRETVLPGMLPFAASLLVCAALDRWFAPESWFVLAVAVLAGVIAYLAVLFGCCLDATDRQLIKQAAARVRLRAGGASRVRGER